MLCLHSGVWGFFWSFSVKSYGFAEGYKAKDDREVKIDSGKLIWCVVQKNAEIFRLQNMPHFHISDEIQPGTRWKFQQPGSFIQLLHTDPTELEKVFLGFLCLNTHTVLFLAADTQARVDGSDCSWGYCDTAGLQKPVKCNLSA